ncbi:MFS transporter [Bacillus pumilus]|uniref:MFS transporter n=1 Tax=Bacillus pumilus TaxID=1408 RepID=UPI0011A1DAB8|nr:MFS transporter [Bacillus pumilus]
MRVVYGEEVFVGKIGRMCGLRVGVGFGMGAMGWVGVGWLIDRLGLRGSMIGVGFLGILGIVGLLLRRDEMIWKWNE